MKLKLYSICLFILLGTLNRSFAQAKLPNIVMYELFDCTNDQTAFKKYLGSHLISSMTDKNSHFKFQPRKNTEKYYQTTDSTNKEVLKRILDTLRFYKIKREDLVHEHFIWLYKTNDAEEYKKSGKTYFTFQKNNKNITVSFKDLGISGDQWILVEPIELTVLKTDTKLPVVTTSSIVDYEPLTRGKYFESLLQQGKLDVLFESFYSEKNMDPDLKKSSPSSFNDIVERMKEEKNEIRKCFQGLKPGSYELKLVDMNWERETHRLKESDRGNYQFTLKNGNKESLLNFKFYVVKDQICLGPFEEKEAMPPIK